MAIRFDYQVGAGMIGAYASGVANATQRKRKYLQDLWQQNQEHQFRMEELGLRTGARQNRLGGFGQQAGTWVDPLAEGPEMPQPGEILPLEDRKKLIQRRAQRKRRARMIGAGRGDEVPAEWQPSFTPAPTKEDVRFDHQKQMAEILNGYRLAAARVAQTGRVDAETRSALRSAALHMPDIPANANAAQVKSLTQLKSYVDGVLLKNEHDLNNQDTLSRVGQAIADYGEQVGAIRPPDPNAMMLVEDPVTKKMRPPNEGEQGTHFALPGQVPQPRPEYAQKLEDEKKVKEKAELEHKATIKKLEDRRTQLTDKLRELRPKADAGEQGAETTAVIEEINAEIRQIDRQWKSLNNVPPAQMQEPRGVEEPLRPMDEPAAGPAAEPTAEQVAGQQPLTPAQMEQGAKWLAALVAQQQRKAAAELPAMSATDPNLGLRLPPKPAAGGAVPAPAAGPKLSPTGQFMWDGSKWIPSGA